MLENARVLAKVLQDRGLRIVSGGTDCHMFLVDLRAKKITGKDAEAALAKAHITVNKNAIPNDPGKAVRHLGHPHRQPGDHDARLHRDRERGARRISIADVLDAPHDEAARWRVRRRRAQR